MEIEQLKDALNDAERLSKPIEALDLRHMLGQKSGNPIAKMKRNLKREVIALVLSYGLLINLLSFSSDSASVYSILLLVIAAVLFMLYAWHKHRLLSNMECISCEVKVNLGIRINALEKLTRLYQKAANVSVPLSFLFVGAMAWNNTDTGLNSLLQSPSGILIFLGIGVIITPIGFYLNRWYIFQLYGKYILQLKTLYHEMDES